jgi:hypothetical protein
LLDKNIIDQVRNFKKFGYLTVKQGKIKFQHVNAEVPKERGTSSVQIFTDLAKKHTKIYGIGY